MPNTPKQRFIGLNVNEISLVDAPANEVEILVMKSAKEQPMSTTAEVIKSENSTAEVVAVDVDATSDNATVSKALESVASIVESVAKAARVAISQPEAKDTMKAVDSEQLETTKAKPKEVEETQSTIKSENPTPAPIINPRDVLKRHLIDAGVDVEVVVKSLATFDEATSKSVVLASQEEKSVEVAKASDFNSLAQSVEILVASVKKSIEDQTTLATRITAIEKARMPAQSLDNNETEQKVEKSNMWSGVL